MTKEEKTCVSCIFYRIGGADAGTCAVSDNIVESHQEACIDHVGDDGG
ncbi:MAG: hypothetical protein NC117_02930 [Pseudoflavonifractor sp.]|nr:hypothetical protein [Pseudoflavonifractor sp.]